MSYQSTQPPQPLSELEEAVLIAITGCTGLTMPDRPFAGPATGKPIMAKPNLNMAGRTAGSPDNAQGTHFFLINDSGTYFLRKLPPADGPSALTPRRCSPGRAQAKVRLLDRRIDVPDGNRDFPAYLDSNRFLSNLPGTTILFPVVDLSRQYINGMMYLLTQPKGRGRRSSTTATSTARPGSRSGSRTASSTRTSSCRSAPSGRCAPRSRPTCCCRT